MEFLKRLFERKETVFLFYQDQVTYTDSEEKLKAELHEYIKHTLRRKWYWPFTKKYIKYADSHTNKKTLQTFYFMTTFDPKTCRRFLPLIYEIYAFTELQDARLFDDYQPEYKEFSNEFQTIKAYKLKL